MPAAKERTTCDLRDVDDAISRAIGYLRDAQLPHGEFGTLLGPDMALSRDCVADSTTFTTSSVLYNLEFVEDPRVSCVTDKGLDFLQSQMQWPGCWRFYSNRQFKCWRLPPDLEDTSCASYVLRLHNRLSMDNRGLILRNRNSQGVFRTWLDWRYRPLAHKRQAVSLAASALLARLRTRIPPKPAHLASSPRFRQKYDPCPLEAVDPSVNASVILYLGENPGTSASIDFLIDLIRKHREEGSSEYYPDTLALYYMISRPCLESAPTLRVLGDPIVRRINARDYPANRPEASIAAAFVASTLMTYRNLGPTLQDAIRRILATQRGDGSWRRYAMFLAPGEYWGSEELSTGFCVEALARYRRQAS